MAAEEEEERSSLEWMSNLSQYNSSRCVHDDDDDEWMSICSLGHGAFATVSLALHLPSSSLFASKSTPIIISSGSSSPQLLALLHELRILRSLSSPFVISCLGSHIRHSRFHLFLEFMDGGSVSDLIRRSGGRLEERRAAEIACAALRGLQYLHAQGVIHGDIKGSNILLNSRREVKLADFGGAGAPRRKPDPESEEEEGPGHNYGLMMFRGTPLWMAPEVLQGLQQDTPSDIWSLGCTVVEMLQGSPPPLLFFTPAAALLLRSGFRSEPPPLPTSISHHGRDFLLRCLHPQPSSRWSASQLLDHPFIAATHLSLPPAAAQASPVYYSPPPTHLIPKPSSPLQSSPRSVLHFFEFDHCCCNSDSEDESPPPPPPPAELRQPATGGGCRFPEAGGWITVRHADCWSDERQKPFMGGGDGGVLNIATTRGDFTRDVEAALSSLLRTRKRRVG